MTLYNEKKKHSEGYISEIFTSIQGEGLYCGARQIFVRFTGCNLRCAFCDTPASHSNPDFCMVEMEPGTFRFREEPNPIVPEILHKHIGTLSYYRNHSIALTGGEPLLQGKFLHSVLPGLKREGHIIYLETNGTQTDQLKLVLPYVDIIAMDIKIPSVAKLGELWYDHEDFLKVAVNKEVFVKIIIGKTMNPIELEMACKLVAKISPHIPLVMQPVTERGGKINFDPVRYMDLQNIAMEYLSDVRVIPQVHKLIGNIM